MAGQPQDIPRHRRARHDRLDRAVRRLFGTVWGIMNSFIGISNAHTTNLAVVAPGIAQALLATALGLVAAIPAVMIYNMLARQNAHSGVARRRLGEVMRLVSRDLDRAKLPMPQAAAGAQSKRRGHPSRSRRPMN